MRIITFFTILTLIFTINSQSQTKTETENFIKKYLEAYPQNNGSKGEKTEIIFKNVDGIGYCFFYINKIPYLAEFIYRIEPENIQSVIIDRYSIENSVMIKVKLKPNKYSMMVLPGGNSIAEYVDNIEIMVGSSSINDQIPERLKKAIEHLANITGGNLTIDKF
jgi:hypothetical protein